ncbi:class Ib ribonucleoside-diphosphate reductase assembly flavoprotein NrdI [Nesterenkonia sp. LB17]|uniref:class Ib ribonucleoside-diphosphate reductase assembly flavoprotein NrdI n=1 Tax=unclassified Nesterenkonia TaxID=2629769 RepID=UPI001F4C972A|nr:class Ib ribonucleoside-diphosphate reductase assembly flavoprotein NrdI [Nesterenkonia sp. DZ6]MCH8563018.1 class Ib ribonucleoside-diphosphate reductase assembly flavoprotein NrdI [Nesterenkonia sp. YGD6]MCH8565165.1 class Ib ribonucleoside-diphosphate reductase assembly flavoprotein NrdI [Nesterenkonia sp. LB17]MCH8571439.1 class Ib ribonucleoside-diphosphate reductase assembly flavoprotein NrdI [Nesterenkonia sp. AY15]
MSTSARLIYFSSVSNNTHRFVEKLQRGAGEVARLPLLTRDETLEAEQPFVLVLPSYGADAGEGSVPKQVIKFLNVESNRNLLRGVIGAGNTNFHESYCIAGDIVAAKCGVPHLYRFELMGTPEDVATVEMGLEEFWKQQPSR